MTVGALINPVSGPASLAVVICTFHREKLLAKALGSLITQHCPADFSVEILVIDNSDEETARHVVDTLADASPFAMRWIAAHPANISVARNVGVAATTASHIAFLDDDQEVMPGWIEAIAGAIQGSIYDAWFGAVEPVFETPDRATPLTRQLFSRRLDAPAGQELVALGPAKTKGLALATSNSIFRRQAMMIGPRPFDPAFGTGGGEDYDLLCRMQQAGSRFGWLPQACAKEFVPASRCDAGYLRARFYAGGQAFAAAISNASPRPVATRWLLRARALVQAGLLIAQAPVKALRGGSIFADYTFVLAGVMGKLSFSDIHPIYRRPK